MAERAAKKSDHTFRIGASIVRNRKVISSGCNKVGHKSQSPFSRWATSIHAEEAAIYNLIKQGLSEKLKGAKLYVVRLASDDSFALALPCPHCMRLIKAVGIKEIFYSTKEGVLRYVLC